MERTIVMAGAMLLAGSAQAAMDCEEMFSKAETMISESDGMTADEKVKAYRMAISAHEMCKDGKKDMAMKMYYETEEYLREEQNRS